MSSRTEAWCFALLTAAADASAKDSEPATSSKILRALSVKAFGLATLALVDGVRKAGETDRFWALASGVVSPAPPGPPEPPGQTGSGIARAPPLSGQGRGLDKTICAWPDIARMQVAASFFAKKMCIRARRSWRH